MNDLRTDCPMRHKNGNCTAAGGFCTAVNDQICAALHTAYECGFYDATYELSKKSDNPKPRKIQKYPDSKKAWQYYTTSLHDPYRCSSNCYHYEYDGQKIIGVCNGCGRDIYEVKPEYVQEYLDKGIWE